MDRKSQKVQGVLISTRNQAFSTAYLLNALLSTRFYFFNRWKIIQLSNSALSYLQSKPDKPTWQKNENTYDSSSWLNSILYKTAVWSSYIKLLSCRLSLRNTILWQEVCMGIVLIRRSQKVKSSLVFPESQICSSPKLQHVFFRQKCKSTFFYL